MRRAEVRMHGTPAGVLEEETRRGICRFAYHEGYAGPPVSLTLPLRGEAYEFTSLPPFFEGLLPEGVQLEALLRLHKLDRDDLFPQLLAVGGDLVGAVTIHEIT